MTKQLMFLLLGVVTLTGSTACSEKKTPTAVAKATALADSADQVMFGTRFFLTDHGVSRADLVADTALFFDDNTRVRLMDVHVTFFNAEGGENAVLTSRQGTYYTQTGTMVANGDVDVKSQDGRELTTQELKYDRIRNQISSDSAFVLTEPTRRLEGVGFRSDPNLQNIQVLQATSGSTGTITIPNQ
jgi:LPS export ABC transporter protein LptC